LLKKKPWRKRQLAPNSERSTSNVQGGILPIDKTAERSDHLIGCWALSVQRSMFKNDERAIGGDSCGFCPKMTCDRLFTPMEQKAQGFAQTEAPRVPP
jgi:hypothetical protein